MKSPRKAQRIRTNAEFKAIFENARFARGTFLKIWCVQTPQSVSGGPKLGIIVSRKTSGSAVVRNLWKRRIRESFRKLRVKIKPECQIVLGARPEQKKVPTFAALNAEIEKLLIKTESLK